MQISFAVTAQLISALVLATDSTIPLLPKHRNFKPLSIFCGCAARFVLDVVGNPEDWFSRDAAQYYNVCVFCSGLMSFSTIFQSYLDSVRLRQGAQCSPL